MIGLFLLSTVYSPLCTLRIIFVIFMASRTEPVSKDLLTMVVNGRQISSAVI